MLLHFTFQAAAFYLKVLIYHKQRGKGLERFLLRILQEVDTAPGLPHGSLANALQLILAHFLPPLAIWVPHALFQYSTTIPSNLKQIVFKINTKSTQTSRSFCQCADIQSSFPASLKRVQHYTRWSQSPHMGFAQSYGSKCLKPLLTVCSEKYQHCIV